MTDTNKKSKRISRKPKWDMYRCAAWFLGCAIVLLCTVIVGVIVLKEKDTEHGAGASENANNPVSLFFIGQELVLEDDMTKILVQVNYEDTENTSEGNIENIMDVNEEENGENVSEDLEIVSSEETTEDTEHNVATTEETEEEGNGQVQDISQWDMETVKANWETIPAGTVLNASQIDSADLGTYFAAYEISDAVFDVINGKSYQENPNVGLGDLRYVKLLHYNFEHQLQVGELVVASDLQGDFIGIFTELFQAEYEIQSMYLVDNYWTGDPTTTDSASIDENNTSCFLYRPATGSGNLSKHAFGRAIDINPQQNPYVSYTSGSPVWSHENANAYIDRNTGLPHVITEEDLCYQTFIKYGFQWGGSWANIKDYQHFYK